jgi:hypothetical protein
VFWAGYQFCRSGYCGLDDVDRVRALHVIHFNEAVAAGFGLFINLIATAA